MCVPTSNLETKPVSSGLAKHVGRIVEDACLKYPGGTAELELVKGDPELVPELYKLFKDRAAKRAELLAFSERPAWRTVTIGTHKDKKSLRQAVLDEGHRISDWSEQVIKNKKFAVETAERKLELFAATVKEITGKDQASVSEIYARLNELGFGICPHETALQLRREYKDQPMDEWRIVISEPLADSDGFLNVLRVVRGQDGSWVSSFFAHPGYVWNGFYRLVFCRK